MLHSPRPKLIPRARLAFALNFTDRRLFSSLSHERSQPSSPSSSPARNELLDLFDHLLRRCCSAEQPGRVHARIVVAGASDSAFLAARLVSVYARFGLLGNARIVFDETPAECKSNLLLWNSILRAYTSNGCHEEALELYVGMRKVGVLGDGFTFPLVMRDCAEMGRSIWCRSVHCHALQMGLHHNLHVVNGLMGMYAKLGQMGSALQLFDRMSARSCISWNTMISGFALKFDCDGALEMFRRMESEGVEPNVVTWTSLLSSHARSGRDAETVELFGLMRMRGIGPSAEVLAVVLSVCSNMIALHMIKAIHGLVIKVGCEAYLIVKNSLVCAYGKQRQLKDASQLFLEMESKNIVSWNALITSYAESGLCDEAFEIFSQLKKSNGCSLVRPNVISWSVIIDAFASAGRGRESLELYRQMQLANIVGNAVTISSVLSVCAELAALNLGREVHGHVARALLNHNLLVANSLITMYMRCGCLNEGSLVFKKLVAKDLISWNSMIAGCGMHGLGKDAVRYFDGMVETGIKPDEVTFVAVLSACSHAGLVVEGRKLYDRMTEEFGIEPQMEHYACLVDLLSRSGSLQEAGEIVKAMPMTPNVCVWGALLNACRMYRDTDFAEATASHVFNQNWETTGSYMLLSNIYAANGQWDDSARLRISAKEKGLKKVPGQSWIELSNKFYMFSSGRALQLGMEDVHGVLEELTLQMETEDVIPAILLKTAGT
ncbi:putative pentatricopeptide repeat-containing protein At1g17630 isoform X1 [Syzygium oleosum]|uniref:putative pentatricopeptide repeat-containing protein At1g17630 isoform X1 n=1 Tax=Syzygium oleosum TaxID=219896 RepID=UPI0024BADAC1|nr:putative pentatricopeptide repeat-containing protein At1g17630 isoform X1 [Syzygium oleosum]